MQERAAPDWLKKWKLYGDSRRVAKSTNCQRVCAAYRAFCGEPTQKLKGASRRAASRAAKAAAAAAAAAAIRKGGDTAVSEPTITRAGQGKEHNLLEEFLNSVNLQDKMRRILHIIKIIDEGLADKVHVSSSVTSPSSAGRKLHFEQEPDDDYSVVQELICEKLTNKLRQQLSDPLAITSGAIPEWYVR